MLLAARPARAHDVGISRGDYVVVGGVVEARLVFAARDRALLLTTSPGELVFVDADDSPCRKTDEQVTPVPQEDAVEIRLRFVCPPDAQELVLQAGFVGASSADPSGHRHLAHVTVEGPPPARTRRELETVLAAGHERVAIATGGDPDAAAEADPGGASSRFVGLLRTGALHVLGGPDHLAFLLALALESASLLELLRVATAFTVAHSATLALAATGMARPPASWIEPLVGLSIAAVAARAVFTARSSSSGAASRSPRSPRSAWPLAFAFGLVHGFAFADALRVIGLHGAALARTVVGFNLGVEAGQLVALAVMVPALAGMVRLVRDRGRVVQVVGTLLTAVSLFWFVARLVGSGGR